MSKTIETIRGIAENLAQKTGHGETVNSSMVADQCREIIAIADALIKSAPKVPVTPSDAGYPKVMVDSSPAKRPNITANSPIQEKTLNAQGYRASDK